MNRHFMNNVIMAGIVMILGGLSGLTHAQQAGTKKSEAPPRSCALLVNVVDSDDTDSRVPAVSVYARRKGSKTSVRPVPVKGMYLFSPLREGEWTIAAVKKGFQNSVLEYELDCDDFASVVQIDLERPFSLSPSISIGSVPASVPFPVYIDPPRAGLGGTSRVGIAGGGMDDESEPPPAPSPRPRTPIKPISGGVLNGKAIELVKPPYPAAARAVKAGGAVNVQVTIDEGGKVISAYATSGHDLLRAVSVDAARRSRFSPTMLEGSPVKVTGVIVYNFVP